MVGQNAAKYHYWVRNEIIDSIGKCIEANNLRKNGRNLFGVDTVNFTDFHPTRGRLQIVNKFPQRFLNSTQMLHWYKKILKRSLHQKHHSQTLQDT